MNRRQYLLNIAAAGTMTIEGCSTKAPPEDDEENFGGDYDGVDGIDGGMNATEYDYVDPGPGTIVFVYDDGPIEDYTQMLPAHRDFDAPATVGVVSNWIGRDGYMGVDHLKALADHGWEIASHTVGHTTVGEFELTRPVGPRDDRVYPTQYRHGHHVGMTVEIADQYGRTVHRNVAGRGEDQHGHYVKLRQEVGEAFGGRTATIRYPADQMERALGESKDTLEGLGFGVRSFLAPYDLFGDYASGFVGDYYDAVANAEHGSRLNDPDWWDPLETSRDYFHEFSDPSAVTRDLDTIADDGLLGVVGAHSYKDDVNEQMVRSFLKQIRERDIRVMTLSDAVDHYD